MPDGSGKPTDGSGQKSATDPKAGGSKPGTGSGSKSGSGTGPQGGKPAGSGKPSAGDPTKPQTSNGAKPDTQPPTGGGSKPAGDAAGSGGKALGWRSEQAATCCFRRQARHAAADGRRVEAGRRPGSPEKRRQPHGRRTAGTGRSRRRRQARCGEGCRQGTRLGQGRGTRRVPGQAPAAAPSPAELRATRPSPAAGNPGANTPRPADSPVRARGINPARGKSDGNSDGSTTGTPASGPGAAEIRRMCGAGDRRGSPPPSKVKDDTKALPHVDAKEPANPRGIGRSQGTFRPPTW